MSSADSYPRDMSRAEQEDMRRRDRAALRPWRSSRLPRRYAEAYPVHLAPESLDLLRLSERIRAQLPIDTSAHELINGNTMTDLANRLSAIGTSEHTSQDPAIALQAEDWCRIEGWGLVRRVRQRDGEFTYEQSSPAGGPTANEHYSFLDDFALPPSATPAERIEGVATEPSVRALANALSRLSSERTSSRQASETVEDSAMFEMDTVYRLNPVPEAERPVSTLHMLVCEFIDEWDAKEHTRDEGVPAEFICPLSHLAMRNPVSSADGHTYDRPMLTKAFRCSRDNNLGKVVSPMTRSVLSHPGQTTMHPCLPMVSLMERWVKKRVAVADGETLESTLKARASCAETEEQALIV